jgi:riboflavin kinase/FMN adenylyltransferase
MKILTGKDNFDNVEKTGIGLGNFDGVHIAHEKLVGELVSECRKRSIPSVIYTFRDHPGNILQRQKIKLISPLEKRIEKFEKLGVDYLILEEFNDEYAVIEPDVFIKEILVSKYKASLVVTGFNYHFGRFGRGDTELLASMGKRYDFEVVTLDPVMSGELVISSTAIRDYIKQGRMAEVKTMMGEFYSIKGKVEYGNRIGTLIGFPTANIIPVRDFALPDTGVYFTQTMVDGKMYNSITNIGIRPTVSSSETKIIETHIFDFNGWLYGKEIEVWFIEKHRDEKKHRDIMELKDQIESDIRKAIEFFKEGSHL